MAAIFSAVCYGDLPPTVCRSSV